MRRAPQWQEASRSIANLKHSYCNAAIATGIVRNGVVSGMSAFADEIPKIRLSVDDPNIGSSHATLHRLEADMVED